ncbi:hypothetical protein [Paenibacillus glucanolyticus]|uniref:hypothetical protein n=1 Tax=Paenibacillus glucanolyticus TaxID=59843 RepID=UPI0030CB4860
MNYQEAITREDRHNVKRYILLPMIISAFERDCRHIEQNLKTTEPYIDAIKAAIDRAHKELMEVKRHFWLKGIKVYEENTTKIGKKAKFMCRGYTSQIELRWEFITAEASVLMRKYLGLDVSRFVDTTLPERLREEY